MLLQLIFDFNIRYLKINKSSFLKSLIFNFIGLITTWERNITKQIKKKMVKFNSYFKITKPKMSLEEITRIQLPKKIRRLGITSL